MEKRKEGTVRGGRKTMEQAKKEVPPPQCSQQVMYIQKCYWINKLPSQI